MRQNCCIIMMAGPRANRQPQWPDRDLGGVSTAGPHSSMAAGSIRVGCTQLKRPRDYSVMNVSFDSRADFCRRPIPTDPCCLAGEAAGSTKYHNCDLLCLDSEGWTVSAH
jgi:hypothetical protein